MKPLKTTSAVSNSEGFSTIGARGLDRDFAFSIERWGDYFRIQPLGNPFSVTEDWGVTIPITPMELFQYVQDLRDVWQAEIVDFAEPSYHRVHGTGTSFPFQDMVDQSTRAAITQAKGAALAKAGKRLYRQVFEISDETRLSAIDLEKRKVVGGRVLELLTNSDKSLVITITSDDFFVPWWMLYVHPSSEEKLKPDGSNFSWDGFLGVRHIIEHNTRRTPRSHVDNRIRPDPKGRFRLSFNVDNSIDDKVECIEPQRKFFRKHGVFDFVERLKKEDLQDALSDSNFEDSFVYFCCHGKSGTNAGGPNLRNAVLKLTDPNEITAEDITEWLEERDLASRPVVFINACQGGQMQTIFYQTVAKVFLRRKAACLVGSQIDIPGIFASAYAQGFFQKLFNPPKAGQPSPRIGQVVRDLTVEFITKYHNPLGLAYSLYRGADCFVAP